MQSKYYKWNKRGSRIIIDSGYKTFDKYIIAISVGNVGGQFSNYIRAYNNVECNGATYEKGHLRDYDLSIFHNLDNNVKEFVKSITNDKSCILYEFYTYTKGKRNKVGYIVEQDNGTYSIFNNSYYAWEKKQKCLEFITKILKEEREVIKW